MLKADTMNSSHKTVAFVPGCLICPCFQAGDSTKNRDWPAAFRAIWEKNPVGLIQMPCPEAVFPMGLAGLGRAPHGVRYYEKLEGFQAHCVRLARQMADQILSFQRAGYAVAAVVGIEHSPTCAVNYMYTRQGTVRRAGIYLNALMDAITAAGADVTYIGVNRRFPDKAAKVLEDAILDADRNYP